MDARQDVISGTTSGAVASAVGWAQAIVRRQLDTLGRLASVAMRKMEDARRREPTDEPRPMLAEVIALERTLRINGKIAWVLRLIDALREKLTGDLERLDRGEAPESVFATEATNDGEPEKRPRSEKAERGEESDRDDDDRLPRGFSDRELAKILKRPPDEIIALICRELDLDPDWPRLVEKAWESETAGRPLSPAVKESAGIGGPEADPPPNKSPEVGRPVAGRSPPSIRFC